MSDSKNFIPLIDPINGGNLKPKSDGTYYNELTNRDFFYDPDKGKLIPLYIPDNTAEKAHVENGMLVGDETGRRFQIDENGVVLTPENIGHKIFKDEEARILKQMERDGTIESYLTRTNTDYNPDIEDILNSDKRTQPTLGNLKQVRETLLYKKFNDYREQIIEALDTQREDSTLIHSSFNIIQGDLPQCIHIIEKVSPDGVVVLNKNIFTYDDEFKKGMLEPSIIDYAKRSPLMTEINNPNEYGYSNYQAQSENNNMLTVANVEPNYAKSISTMIKQTDPVLYKEQAAIQTSPNRANLGFTNTLFLSVLVGIIFGISILLAIVLI